MVSSRVGDWGMLGVAGACIGGNLHCFRLLSGKLVFPMLQVEFCNGIVGLFK